MAQEHSITGFQGLNVIKAAEFLEQGGLISRADIVALRELRQLRNEIVHERTEHRQALNAEIVAKAHTLTERFREKS